jgi:hypothetical protein
VFAGGGDGGGTGLGGIGVVDAGGEMGGLVGLDGVCYGD